MLFCIAISGKKPHLWGSVVRLDSTCYSSCFISLFDIKSCSFGKISTSSCVTDAIFFFKSPDTQQSSDEWWVVVGVGGGGCESRRLNLNRNWPTSTSLWAF